MDQLIKVKKSTSIILDRTIIELDFGGLQLPKIITFSSPYTNHNGGKEKKVTDYLRT